MNTVDLVWRSAEPADAGVVIAAIDDWWPGTPMVHGICPQLFEHFGDTCLIVEADGRLAAFLVGLMSQRFPNAGDEVVAGLPVRHPKGHGFDYVAMVWRLGDAPGART